MKNLRSMLPNEIEDILAGLGEPKYRAKQVFKWLGRGIGSIDEMSDIPKSLREKLKTEYTVYEPKVLSKQVSKIDGTIKYLWELYDGNAVETVVMSYKHGNTVCVSTQVGCRQGCAFCAMYCTVAETLSGFSAMFIAFTMTVAAARPSMLSAVPTIV